MLRSNKHIVYCFTFQNVFIMKTNENLECHKQINDASDYFPYKHQHVHVFGFLPERSLKFIVLPEKPSSNLDSWPKIPQWIINFRILLDHKNANFHMPRCCASRKRQISINSIACESKFKWKLRWKVKLCWPLCVLSTFLPVVTHVWIAPSSTSIVSYPVSFVLKIKLL